MTQEGNHAIRKEKRKFGNDSREMVAEEQIAGKNIPLNDHLPTDMETDVNDESERRKRRRRGSTRSNDS